MPHPDCSIPQDRESERNRENSAQQVGESQILDANRIHIYKKYRQKEKNSDIGIPHDKDGGNPTDDKAGKNKEAVELGKLNDQDSKRA
jgi:hypothetical protein